MLFLKKVKSKKVISIVLVFIVSFCTIFTKPTNAETKQLNNNQNKIEIKNINNKVIGIKGRDNMRNNNIQGRKLHVKATAYCNDPITSTGVKPRPMHTLAVDPKVIPYGTKVYIPQFGKVFVAEDCGGAIKGNRIDIYMGSYNECMKFGVQNIDIIILNN